MVVKKYFTIIIPTTAKRTCIRITAIIDRSQGGGVNLAGKVKNLFLVTIDVYRLENRKIEACQLSGGHGGLGAPGNVKYLARDPI